MNNLHNMGRRINKIAKTMLELLSDTGEIIVDPAYRSMSGALTMLSLTLEERKNKRLRARYLRTSLRLKQSQLIVEHERPDGTSVVSLTERGKRKIREFSFWDLRIKIQSRWDKKFRLVIFDIPKSRGKTRTIFTRKLKELGLYPFQKSVWIFPYPCKQEVEFLAEYLGLNKYVYLIEANSITNDLPIRRHFRLDVS